LARCWACPSELPAEVPELGGMAESLQPFSNQQLARARRQSGFMGRA